MTLPDKRRRRGAVLSSKRETIRFLKFFSVIFAQILMKFYRNFTNIFWENIEIFYELLNILAKIPEFWKNIDRTPMWIVRLVRSLAGRTFQPRLRDLTWGQKGDWRDGESVRVWVEERPIETAVRPVDYFDSVRE